MFNTSDMSVGPLEGLQVPSNAPHENAILEAIPPRQHLAGFKNQHLYALEQFSCMTV
jgi:hypothetical protein